jgi:hypothetical protein
MLYLLEYMNSFEQFGEMLTFKEGMATFFIK